MKYFIIFLFTLITVNVAQISFAADIDLSKAITIGSGPQTVIEFTDPDCPYCRKASKYFETRSDITRHVFFYPLPRHPKAKEKAQYALSQMDRSSAYREVMSGRMDSVAKITGTTSLGIKQLEEHLDMAKKQKINSTPTFIVNGRIIVGFDQKKIEEALGK